MDLGHVKQFDRSKADSAGPNPCRKVRVVAKVRGFAFPEVEAQDNALYLYPVLFLEYLKSDISTSVSGFSRIGAAWGLAIVLTFLNCMGLTINSKIETFEMVGGGSEQCGLESVFEYSILESLLLGFHKDTCWGNKEPKENSSKGFVLSSFIILFPTSDRYRRSSSRPFFMVGRRLSVKAPIL
ncbi:hypothetical protein K1719_003684 [Acacia pycnantha]|nr:hypothetical protein K1719_003684 [Acacia pycnantha]